MAVDTNLEYLELAAWRRRTAELYALVRDLASLSADPQSAAGGPRAAWNRFREVRDAMFTDHPQSPIEKNDAGALLPLRYFPYNPAWRLEGDVLPLDEAVRSGGEVVTSARSVELPGGSFATGRSPSSVSFPRRFLREPPRTRRAISRCSGSKDTEVASSCRSRTPHAASTLTAVGGISMIRSRAQIPERCVNGFRSTSTSRTIRRAPTAQGGSARSRHRKTRCPFGSKPERWRRAVSGRGSGGMGCRKS